MRKLAIALLCSLPFYAFAQDFAEKEVKTEVNEVTVFIEGAQVTRKKTVELPQGKTVVKFVNLSPFIDAKSVQVKANGELTVLSVNHQQNFINKLDKPKELVDLEAKLKSIDEKINLENTYLSIVGEQLVFLQQNRDIGGKNQETSIINLKETMTFYSTQLSALKLKEIEHNKNIQELSKQRSDIENQIKTITSKKEYPNGEVLVKVDTKRAGTFEFEVSYLVNNAGWFPTYDIRAKNISEPIQIIYKANVRQETKEDWKNVKLRFSSSNPNSSGVAPELKTYFLNYNSIPPVYNIKQGSNIAKGTVISADDGLPLPGVAVMVKGTTIGAATDVNGNFTLTMPSNGGTLVFSFIGYKALEMPFYGDYMNITLEPESLALKEVVVTAYGVNAEREDRAFSGRVGAQTKKAESIKIRGASSLAIPSEMVVKQTTVDFEIKTPYTVLSDNKSYAVDMAAYELPASYQYYCVPKIQKDAFLIANIVDWEKYSLLEGEANIFFEDSYVGKTLLNLSAANDTLSISLGKDKNVSVNREKVKDFTTKQFIGNKKEETRSWLTTVKNNKNQPISMIILDQTPVSTLEEIEVQIQDLSTGKHDKETGEVKWEFNLEPSTKKEFSLKYSVKYPKGRKLVIE
ncbi:MAG TPA: mucoidy inhibitor MuiA family protein [Tenuifilaceae bacterium]|nr:mucoidy inhibitor MuiA family protein [Tenuifilaceae bacterium]HPI43879.1 mucoidy inhibitor MuiA family protein [Tenuifilaceae bacterium]